MKLKIAYKKAIMSKSYKQIIVSNLTLNALENDDNIKLLELNSLNNSLYHIKIASHTLTKWLKVYVK